MQIDITGSETNELLNTLFYQRPQYEILDNGKKGRIVAGYEGILLYGGMNIGKTIDILIAIKFVAQYQSPTGALRKIKVGVVKESNDSFVENFISKIEIFDPPMDSKTGIGGFYTYDSKQRAKCKWRFRGQYPDDEGNMKEDGTVTEIEFHCMAVPTEADRLKWKNEMTIIIFNEMNLYSEKVFDLLSARKNRYPFGKIDFQFWIGDLNPELESNWEYQRFIKSRVDGVKVIEYKAPLIWVPDPKGKQTYMGRAGTFKENRQFNPKREDGYAYWHAMTSGSDQSITNNVFGKYYRGSSGTAIHTAFSVDHHVKSVEPPDYSDVIVVGVDPGYANGFVTGYFREVSVDINDALDGDVVRRTKANKFHVMDCYYGDGGFHKTWHEVLNPLLHTPDYKHHADTKRILFIADPRTIKKRSLTSGEMSIEIIIDHGFEVTVPVDEYGKIVDDIGLRVGTVSKALKLMLLTIDPRNEPLVTSFVSGYVSKGDSSAPDKRKSGGYAEVMDSLEYILLFDALGGNILDHIGALNFSRDANDVYRMTSY